MRSLEPPDTFHFSAARGWLELGNPTEAKKELTLLSPEAQNHPDVLEVRWLICANEKRWVDGLEIARELMAQAPDRAVGWLNQAYSLRRIPEGSVKKAWDALLPAFDKFPGDAVIPYNLACYACQLDLLDAARVWLKRACVIGDERHIKRMALADADLRPLWEEIRTGSLS